MNVCKELNWIIDDPTINKCEKTSALNNALSNIDKNTVIGLSWLVIVDNWNDELEEFIKTLILKYGVNVNERDDRNYTPLMWAAIFDKYRAVRLLLSLGADPHLKQSHNKTAFYFASECDNILSLAELNNTFLLNK